MPDVLLLYIKGKDEENLENWFTVNTNGGDL